MIKTITFIIITFTLSLILFLASANAIDLDIISQIESSNNPMAISYRGAKYGRGLFQISEVCLRDYNNHNHTKFNAQDLFDPTVNRMVAEWYFKQLERYLMNYKLPINNTNILISYNWGIGNLRKYEQGLKNLPEETKNYIKKYFQIRGRDA